MICLHLAEGFFERISAIHILIPFAVYRDDRILPACSWVLNIWSSVFKVFVIYEYFPKSIKFFIMIFQFMLLFLFSYPVQRYSFYLKRAHHFYIMRLLFTYYNICLPMITSSFFASYSRPGIGFLRQNMAPERFRHG